MTSTVVLGGVQCTYLASLGIKGMAAFFIVIYIMFLYYK